MDGPVHLNEPPSGGRPAKLEEFEAAIALYEGRRRYRFLGHVVAATIVVCQLDLARRAFLHHSGPFALVAVAVCAYLAADLVNGVVHLWMDHSDAYTSWAGPMIAHFHLHHRTPRYLRRPLLAVYFLESGSKIWLAILLALAVALSSGLPSRVVEFLALFGVFSSVAEVSHYLCHTSNSRIAVFLGKARILLHKAHLERHHGQDNRSYAFLNGLSDPLIDWIAAKYFKGYKAGTDLDYARYEPAIGKPRADGR